MKTALAMLDLMVWVTHYDLQMKNSGVNIHSLKGVTPIEAVDRGSMPKEEIFGNFKHLWADNGDSLSRIYTGAGSTTSAATRNGAGIGYGSHVVHFGRNTVHPDFPVTVQVPFLRNFQVKVNAGPAADKSALAQGNPVDRDFTDLFQFRTHSPFPELINCPLRGIVIRVRACIPAAKPVGESIKPFHNPVVCLAKFYDLLQDRVILRRRKTLRKSHNGGNSQRYDY